jgi:hypothetical protein
MQEIIADNGGNLNGLRQKGGRSSIRTARATLMTDEHVPVAGPRSGWQLIAEFAGVSLSDDAGSLLDAVIDAVQGVNLGRQQVERIRRSLVAAIARASRAGTGPAAPALRIRVWRTGSCTGDCGWGFFLVEKQSGVAAGDTEQVVELFLYQERES